MTEIEFIEVVDAVCGRPAMYTKSGAFYEVVSFLEGYAIGANVGNISAHSKFTPFLKWLEKQSSFKGTDLNWDVFREHFDSDVEALRNLSSFYSDYAKNVISK